GSGVGVLPSTGLSSSSNGMSLAPRSTSLPVAPDFKSDFVIPPPPPPMQSSPPLHYGSSTVSPTQQPLAPVYNNNNGNEDAQSGSNEMQEPSPPAGSQGSGNASYLRVARFVGPPPVPLACTECRSRHL